MAVELSVVSNLPQIRSSVDAVSLGMEFDGTIVSGDFSSSQTIAGWWFGTVINNGY